MSHAVLGLSPIDHVFTGIGAYPVEFVFAYAGTLDSARLRASLDGTLEQFWPLSSKLVRVTQDSYGLQPADDGLVFETTNFAGAFDSTQNTSTFLDPVHTIEGEPLTRIKLTQTPQGSVLGVSISHAVVDGFSYFHFLSSWSRVFQGQRILTPDHRRELLTPGAPRSQAPLTPAEIVARCGLFWAGKRQPVARTQFREERLLISKAAMDELLAEAQADCKVPLFHNDALTAHLWQRCLTVWLQGQGNPAVYMSCPVDFRRRLRAVPRTYFGSAILGAVASIDLESLASAPLGKLAILVRQAVARVRGDNVLSALQTLDRLRSQEGVSAMQEIHVRHPQQGMVVTNISRLPLQSLDFGAGPPTAFRALTSTPQGAAILPADDGVDIRVYHPSDA